MVLVYCLFFLNSIYAAKVIFLYFILIERQCCLMCYTSRMYMIWSFLFTIIMMPLCKSVCTYITLLHVTTYLRIYLYVRKQSCCMLPHTYAFIPISAIPIAAGGACVRSKTRICHLVSGQPVRTYLATSTGASSAAVKVKVTLCTCRGGRTNLHCIPRARKIWNLSESIFFSLFLLSFFFFTMNTLYVMVQ